MSFQLWTQGIQKLNISMWISIYIDQFEVIELIKYVYKYKHIHTTLNRDFLFCAK